MRNFFEFLARLFALLGGVTLTALIVLTCASVLGRGLNSILHSDLLQGIAPGLSAALLATGVGPINGDFEMVEAGMAFAIFAFIPICQLHGAHASVDIFTARLRPRVNQILRTGIEIVFAAVLILFAWQLMQGGLSKFRSGQTTLLLEFPVWWSYAACTLAAWAAALVGVYVAATRLVAVIAHDPDPFPEAGASH